MSALPLREVQVSKLNEILMGVFLAVAILDVTVMTAAISCDVYHRHLARRPCPCERCK